MKITIDEDISKINGLDLASVLLIVLIKTGADIPSLLMDMENKEIIVKSPINTTKYLITQRWDDICSNILLSSDSSIPSDSYTETLAKALMEIFPKGKKEGTNVYWRSNIKDTKLRLKKFFKLYGNRYTSNQILEAAKAYVDSFNGNYSYMRILKYFIWKDSKKTDSDGNGYIEETSDLATFIENKGDENLNKDWNIELK